MIAWLAAKPSFPESQNKSTAKMAQARREFSKVRTSLRYRTLHDHDRNGSISRSANSFSNRSLGNTPSEPALVRNGNSARHGTPVKLIRTSRFVSLASDI